MKFIILLLMCCMFTGCKVYQDGIQQCKRICGSFENIHSIVPLSNKDICTCKNERDIYHQLYDGAKYAPTETTTKESKYTCTTRIKEVK